MATIEEKLRERGATTPERRNAHFVSALCVAWPDGHVEEFEARVDGTLVWPPRGDQGFGYDPMFLPDGHTRTFGEMSSEEKHGLPPRGKGLSHRARAFLKLAEACLVDQVCLTLSSPPSASTSTGRSACRNVPIATSTAMCAASRSTRRASSRALHAEIAATAARAPGRTVSTIFFGGGTPSLMQPATVAGVLDADRAALARRARRRGDARSQPDQRRGDTLSRLSRRRRQPRLAWRAGARRPRACRTWPHAYGARGARRGRRRALGVRSLFVRSDLRAAAADAGGMGG